MSDPTYDELPYESAPIPYASPASLAFAALRDGGPRAAVHDARVVELGCGDGANLLALAAHRPGWRFLGVDSSPRALAAARDGVRALGLENVELREADLAELTLEPTWDYVVAHGVYSWIDAARRAALRELARAALAPEGLAYVSFNAMPGWGVRGRVRDVMRGAGGVDGARARAAGLRALLGDSVHPWGQLLGGELERVRDASDAYLAHEYLAPHNDAFWLEEVVRDFASAGLRYAGDALRAHREGWVDPALRERVGSLAADASGAETLLDLLGFRQLRGAIFARDDAPAAGGGLLDEAFVSGALRPERDPFDPSPGVEERFVGPQGAEVRVSFSAGKVALLELGARYPDAFTVEELLARADEMLRELGVGASAPGDDVRLRDGLTALHEGREIEARLERPRLRTTPGQLPEVDRLTRWEAARRAVVTTPIHTTVPLDPIDRELTAWLDGTRTVDAAVDALLGAIEAGTVQLEGAPAGASRMRPVLEDRAARLVTTLSWWGLVR